MHRAWPEDQPMRSTPCSARRQSTPTTAPPAHFRRQAGRPQKSAAAPGLRSGRSGTLCKERCRAGFAVNMFSTSGSLQPQKNSPNACSNTDKCISTGDRCRALSTIGTASMKLLIVDDHPVVVSGCRSLFASDRSIKIDEACRRKIRSSRVSSETSRRHDYRHQPAGSFRFRTDAADSKGRSRREDHHVQHE